MPFDWADRTPATERLWSRLDVSDLDDIRHCDRADVRDPEADAVPDEHPTSLRNRLREWELMIRRMADGWPPYGYYLLDEYVNDLSIRDGIDTAIGRLREPLASHVRQLVRELDTEFAALTEDDAEREIFAHYLPPEDPADLGPWWHRVPRTRPWSR